MTYGETHPFAPAPPLLRLFRCLSDELPIAPEESILASSPEELLEAAREFLTHHRWCQEILNLNLHHDWEGIQALLWAEIDPGPGADETVWVIVGDVPPAYIDTPSCPTAYSALDAYLNCMQEWVDRVNAGATVEDCIPVLRRGSLAPMPPSKETAGMLGGRLEFIREQMLPKLE